MTEGLQGYLFLTVKDPYTFMHPSLKIRASYSLLYMVSQFHTKSRSLQPFIFTIKDPFAILHEAWDTI